MQTILIIDDDRDTCNLLKRFLSRHGYDVIETYSGKKALEILESPEPALVMCDFRLEDMQGNELLGKIKERYPSMPVIIITGYSDIKIAVEVMKMGAYDYITKPLFPDEILVTIKKALEDAERGESSPAVHASSPTTQSVAGAAPEQRSASTATSRDKTQGVTVSGEYIFGHSPVFKQILQQIDLVAPT